MSLTGEIILGVVGLAVILGMAGGSMLLAFVLLPWLERRAFQKRFPVVVPGWGMRLSAEPPFDASSKTIGRALKLMHDRAVQVKGYKSAAVKRVFQKFAIEWVRAKNEDGERYIVDEYGRKIAGDHHGHRARVVFLDSDRIQNTAFFHELGHELQEELDKELDYEHRDVDMWTGIVAHCKKEFRDG